MEELAANDIGGCIRELHQDYAVQRNPPSARKTLSKESK